MEPLPPPGPPPPGFDMTGTAIPAVGPSPALSVGAMANSNLNAMDVEPIPEDFGGSETVGPRPLLNIILRLVFDNLWDVVVIEL